MTYGERTVWIVETKYSEYSENLRAIASDYFYKICIRQTDLEVVAWLFTDLTHAEFFCDRLAMMRLFVRLAP